jgi:hypothetical protein
MMRWQTCSNRHTATDMLLCCNIHTFSLPAAQTCEFISGLDVGGKYRAKRDRQYVESVERQRGGGLSLESTVFFFRVAVHHF